MNAYALIPAGGQSRRMGLNKVLLPRNATDTTPIWAHVAALAAATCTTVTVLAPPTDDAGGTQDEAGERMLNGLARRNNIRIVQDPSAYEGPLQALAAAWDASIPVDATHIFLLASDLPGLNASVLEALREAAANYPDADGVAVMRDGRRQPLLGLYRPSVGQSLKQHAKTGSHRLLPAFEGLKLIELDEQKLIWPEWWTRPVHTPADYAEWLRWSAGNNRA